MWIAFGIVDCFCRFEESTIKIYFVDDEKMILQVFSKAMKYANLGPDVSFSVFDVPQLCLEQLEFDHQQNSLPNLIFSDINMPEISGFKLVEDIKKKYPKIVVNFITAYNKEEYRKAAEELGVARFWTKPVELPALFAYIRQFQAENAQGSSLNYDSTK